MQLNILGPLTLFPGKAFQRNPSMLGYPLADSNTFSPVYPCPTNCFETSINGIVDGPDTSTDEGLGPLAVEEEEALVAFGTFAPIAVGRFVREADVLDSGALSFGTGEGINIVTGEGFDVGTDEGIGAGTGEGIDAGTGEGLGAGTCEGLDTGTTGGDFDAAFAEGFDLTTEARV